MPPTTAPARLLAAVRDVLAGWGDRWRLFGAQAVILWGRPRLTADVDITVRLEPENPSGFCADMARASFRLRVPDPESFLERTRVLPFLHQATGLPLDVVLAGPGLEEQFLERAVRVEVEGVAVPVIAPEDLIVMKILAGRSKDLEDLQSVLAARAGTLDKERVRSTLSVLEQALSRGDLLALFDAEYARAMRMRQRL